ncbi:MAG: hypothetical protein WHS65_05350 [Melioribacteraceae bacterium]
MDEKNLIHQIIRKIISNNAAYSDIKEFDIQITKMVSVWLRDKGIVDEELIKDLKQQVIQSLYESFDNNKFWQEKSAETEDNNKMIISYIYSIIKSSHRILTKSILSEESKNLRTAVINSLNSLVAENKVIKINKYDTDYFSVNNNVEKKLYDGYLEVRKLFILRQNSSSSIGRVNGAEVYKAVYEILENLENYYLSISDIMDILLNNSDITSRTSVALDSTDENEEYDNIISEEHLLIQDKKTEPFDYDAFLENCNARLKYFLQNEKKVELHKICFFLYYKADFTYDEIRNYIMQHYNKKISIQTVKNYIDNTILILDFQRYFDSDSKEFYNAIEYLMNSIAKEFNLTNE